MRAVPNDLFKALADPTGRAIYKHLVRDGELEIEAQRKTSNTWVLGDMDTIVTFTPTPTVSGTRLSLLHSGFRPDQKQNLGGARYGWKMMGGKLVELLARVP
jgi:uncharacterized protein YndB with AHSA1/START domain